MGLAVDGDAERAELAGFVGEGRPEGIGHLEDERSGVGRLVDHPGDAERVEGPVPAGGRREGGGRRDSHVRKR